MANLLAYINEIHIAQKGAERIKRNLKLGVE